MVYCVGRGKLFQVCQSRCFEFRLTGLVDQRSRETVLYVHGTYHVQDGCINSSAFGGEVSMASMIKTRGVWFCSEQRVHIGKTAMIGDSSIDIRSLEWISIQVVVGGGSRTRS